MKRTLIILVPLILSGYGPEGKFPILECVFNNPDGSTTKMIYDLRNEYAKKKKLAMTKILDLMTLHLQMNIDSRYLSSRKQYGHS